MTKKLKNSTNKLANGLIKNLRGRVVKSNVYFKDNSYLYLDLGSKVNPRLSNRYLKKNLGREERTSLEVGREIDFSIKEMETYEGDLLLTLPKKSDNGRKEVWSALKAHYEKEEPVIGRILNPVKGGFTVGFSGFTAFLPNSHLVKGRSPSYSHWLKRTRPYIGALLYFKILELNPNERNFVVSRTAALTSEGTLRQPSVKKRDEK